MKHLLPILAIALAACQGPVGPAGAPGTDGIDGRDGAANVQTITFTVPGTGFLQTVGLETLEYAVPQITRTIAQDGMVIAYSNLGSPNPDDWYALPLVMPMNGNAINLTYAYSTGAVYLHVMAESGSGWSKMFAGHTIKLVLIPPVN